MQEQEAVKISAWPLLIAGGLFLVILAVFLVEFIGFSHDDGGLSDESVTADSYMADVLPLLVNADPARGAQLVLDKGCTACHGNQNLAPDYAVTRAMAGERRPPMQAVAYVYESILHPGAFLVEGYQNNMPRTFSSLSGRDLGDIIAHITGVTIDSLEAGINPGATPETTIEPIRELAAEATIEVTPESLTQAMIDECEMSAEFLLIGADPSRGAELLEKYGCNACHGEATAGTVAPHLVDLETAAEQRPPLSEAAYIYESIKYPRRFILDGWTPTMPIDISDPITPQDLGDLMAYLMETQH